ncbi:MAG TPA: hypothetical protein VLL54_20545 [Pyrinomonadaceae bacterium]|nr:hypothetical protein [Pyrinomonadaceae bacterium]
MVKLAKVVFTIIFLAGAVGHPVRGAATPVVHKEFDSQSRLTISVSDEGWGESRIQDIEKVLYSAAGEILAYIPNTPELAIIVRHSEDQPLTLYKRGPNGEFIVLLTAQDMRWAQFAYQFSHEFCHVLAMNSKVTDNPNQWFEESLGETASLFALRRMSKTWRSSPPYPNWKDYASSLRSYAQNTINESHRSLPSDMTLSEWFEENEKSLRNDPYLREKDELVANQLLSLFEENPDGWAAVTYLNRSQPSRRQTFEEYLKAATRNSRRL